MINPRNIDVKHMTIGEMARLNNISEQTLRLYDKIGLLSPAIRDSKNGYRYYDIRQNAVLDIIQYMKVIGMPLKDIREHIGSWDIPKIKMLLEANGEVINHKIQELKIRKRALERALECCQRYESSPPDGSIVLEYIPERSIYTTDTGINFYDYGIDEYESILCGLKSDLSSNGVSPIYFYNAGTILEQEKFLLNKLYSTQVFVFVDKEYVDPKHITVLPPNAYLCIYCDSFDKEKEYIQRLLIRIREMHYTVVGDYICEAILEMPSDYAERGMFLRLQVPVKIS